MFHISRGQNDGYHKAIGASRDRFRLCRTCNLAIAPQNPWQGFWVIGDFLFCIFYLVMGNG